MDKNVQYLSVTVAVTYTESFWYPRGHPMRAVLLTKAIKLKFPSLHCV
jgi:hypothetical protein